MLRFLAIVVVVCSAVLLSSTDQPAFTTLDKAFYADANLVNFVRPGLVVTITGASIAPDGTIKAQFTLADPRGLPLDREGITTPGAVSTSFVAAYIPPGQIDYIAYTKRPQTSPITNVTAVQPAADAGGTFTRPATGSTHIHSRRKRRRVSARMPRRQSASMRRGTSRSSTSGPTPTTPRSISSRTAPPSPMSTR